MTIKHLVTVQLPDNRIRFVDGDALTSRREHATRFVEEAKAKEEAARWAARSDIKAAWIANGN